ncbi:MAG: AbrB/MazE/SpoVT family DNA-binding domain-containing protein [bacterium]
MKSIGIVRKIDTLGRVVIPKELRDIMDLPEKSPVEIFVNEDQIIFTKYNPGCIFCGDVQNVIEYHDKYVCKNCLDEMGNISD